MTSYWVWVNSYKTDTVCSECKRTIPTTVRRAFHRFAKRPACESCAVTRLGIPVPGDVTTKPLKKRATTTAVEERYQHQGDDESDSVDEQEVKTDKPKRLQLPALVWANPHSFKYCCFCQASLQEGTHRAQVTGKSLYVCRPCAAERGLEATDEFLENIVKASWEQYQEEKAQRYAIAERMERIEQLLTDKLERLLQEKPTAPDKPARVESTKREFPTWWQPIQDRLAQMPASLFTSGLCSVEVFEAHRIVLATKTQGFHGTVTNKIPVIKEAVTAATGTTPTITVVVRPDRQELPWAQLENPVDCVR